MSEPSRWQLERYLPLLRLRARQLQLDRRLKRLWDSSDIVQDTYCRALEKLDQFEGGPSEGKLVRWLQRILDNIVKDKIDAAHAQKRDIGLVQSMHEALSESHGRLEKILEAAQSSPSERAEREELLLKVSEALERLPQDQRDVVILHHVMEATASKIAEQMGCTRSAVVGLLCRGMKKLRKILQDEGPDVKEP
jgi:RNA polymerase sigma-70 factor (ECF subfamily)